MVPSDYLTSSESVKTVFLCLELSRADPYDKSFRTSMAEVNEDRTVYLIDDLEIVRA